MVAPSVHFAVFLSPTLMPLHVVFQVTADGSFDCANEPGEQEAKVASLVYAEAITAVSLLQAGGSLVLKMFTLFEHTSICLLYLLCCTFEQVCLAFDHRSILLTSTVPHIPAFVLLDCF